jgi:hypothetical protein
MTTLKQALAIRRAELMGDRPDCYSTKERATKLRIEASDGVEWLLPWVNFLSSRLEEEDDQERLVLTFQGHEVVLHGENLRKLMDMIVDMNLASLHPMPGQYLKAFGEEPFIKHAQVRPIAGPSSPVFNPDGLKSPRQMLSQQV